MEFRLKLVTTVAAASLAAGLASCGPAEQTQASSDAGMDHSAMGSEAATTAAPGGVGGESEGGAMAVMTPDQQHMLRLALIQGHLTAGDELIARGRMDMGGGHAAHPREEIYNNSEAEFEARGQGALGAALDAYLAAVRGGAPDADRQAAREAVFAILADASSKMSLADHAEGLSALLADATSEYGVGVVDGKLVTPHEYQDAWGFIHAAYNIFEARKAEYVAANPTAAAEVETKLEAAMAAFPDILSETPPPAATIRATTTQAALALVPFRETA
jgi:hypothetical protein